MLSLHPDQNRFHGDSDSAHAVRPPTSAYTADLESLRHPADHSAERLIGNAPILVCFASKSVPLLRHSGRSDL